MFDSGPYHFYVSSSLVKRVRPMWVSAKNMSYAAFSSKANQFEKCLSLQGLNGTVSEIEAVEVKQFVFHYRDLKFHAIY